VQVIEGMALRKPRPSIAAMHRSMTALATQHQWMPPSYGSVYGIVRHLSGFSPLEMRQLIDSKRQHQKV